MKPLKCIIKDLKLWRVVIMYVIERIYSNLPRQKKEIKKKQQKSSFVIFILYIMSDRLISLLQLYTQNKKKNRKTLFK